MGSHPWYAFYPSDYRNKTSGLTMVQDCAYRRLMDEYYLTGEPLPANASVLLRICRAFADDEKAAVLFVLSEYFVEGDDGWHHLRIDEEIVKRAEITEKRRKAGKMGGEKPRSISQADAIAKPKHLPTQSQSHTQEKKEERLRASRFQEFWEAHPKKIDRPQTEAAWLRAIETTDPETIIAAVRVYAAEVLREKPESKFIKTPAPWLNGRRWEQHAPPVPPFENTNPEGWAKRLNIFREKSLWTPKWGPKPGEPDCKCPPELLKEAA